MRPTGTLPSSFTITLLDSSNNPVNPQPAFFGQTINIDLESTYKYQNTWVVETGGDFKLRFERADTGDLLSFVIYDLYIQIYGTTNKVVRETSILRSVD